MVAPTIHERAWQAAPYIATWATLAVAQVAACGRPGGVRSSRLLRSPRWRAVVQALAVAQVACGRPVPCGRPGGVRLPGRSNALWDCGRQALAVAQVACGRPGPSYHRFQGGEGDGQVLEAEQETSFV
jgi:hypothetical protein